VGKILDFKWLSVMLFSQNHGIDEPFGEGSYGNVMHGLAPFCPEAGYGGNNEDVALNTRVLHFYPTLTPKNYDLSLKNCKKNKGVRHGSSQFL
jgi:hypothetical protein